MFALVAVVALLVATYTPIKAYAYSNYDFARKGDIGYSTFYAWDLLSDMGYEVSDTEKELLSTVSDFEITYSNSIPSSYVEEKYENGVVAVTALDYSYKTASNKTVVWTPTAAYLGSESMIGGSGTWTGVASEQSGDTVRVEYLLTSSIDADSINAFSNKAFQFARQANDKITSENDRYELELAEYNQKYQNYLDYLDAATQYEIDLELYDEYLVNLASWQLQNSAYQTYLQEYEQYLIELEQYNNYDKILQQYYADFAAYQQYLADVDDYYTAMEKYNEQLLSPDVQKVLYQISILDYLTKRVNLNRTLMGAIMGNSVTQVLAQTEALVLAGAERAAVERANNATLALRNLFTIYSDAKTNEQKYAYYISCYDSLKDNFILLLQTLDYFYGFSMVRNAIKQYDRIEEYEILLAQLYYVSNALSDVKIPNYVQAFKYDKTGGGYFDSSYRVGPSKTAPAALVGKGGEVEDRQSGAPIESGYVKIPVMPTLPEEVAHPGAIPEQITPVMPEVVANPGDMPIEVIEPTEPTEVVEPVAPIAYKPTEQEAKLSALIDGGLTEREQLTDDYILTLKIEITKYFRNALLATLRFYERFDSAEPLYVVEATIGSYVDYPLSLPTKTREGYSCQFDFWQDENGNKIDLNSLATDKGDLSLYAHFNETPLLYTVIWYVNGTRLTSKYAYDSSPVYDEALGAPLSKPSYNDRQYRFSGWKNAVSGESYAQDESLPVMKGSVQIYEAVFESSYIVEWVVDGRRTRQSIWGGEMPVYLGSTSKPTDEYFSYHFAGWDKEIQPVSADVVYVAQFDKEFLCGYSNSGAKVTLSDGVYIADCSASTAMRFNVGGMLGLCAQNGAAMQVNLPRATLYFSQAAAYSANAQGAYAMVIGIVGLADKEYLFYLRFFDRQGQLIELSEVYGVLTTTGSFDADYSFLVAVDGQGNSTDIRFSASANSISFTIKTNVEYNLRLQYTVGVVPSDSVTINTSVKRARVGETVVITLTDLAPGKKISSVYAVDSNGNDVCVTDLSLVMPNSSVTIGVVCSYIDYVITFKSEGRTLLTQTYRYGDSIVSPLSPIKPSDDEYEYVFVGWDNELGIVTQDAVYNAVFEKRAIQKELPPESTLNKLIKAAYVVVPIVAVLIICLIIFLIVRRRKKLNKQK